MDIKKQFCFVQFKYIYNPEPFEDVRILGNIDTLGNWQPNKAIKLFLNKKEKNIWITKEKIKIPLSFNLEYKYLIFKNDSLKTWEEISNNENRKINLTKKGYYTLLDKPKYFSTEVMTEKKNISEYEEGDLKCLNYDSDEEEKKSSKKTSEESNNEYIEIKDNEDIIMFSFFLPINIEKNKENNKFIFLNTNQPFYNTLYKITKEKKNIKWFGFIKEELNYKKEEKEKIKQLLQEKNMFLLEYDNNCYKDLLELINNYIEPEINFTSEDNSLILDFKKISKLWENYKSFNQYIANIILKYITSSNVLIYLHDFQFFLVPNELHDLLRHNSDMLSKISIGIFLHNSFPPFDIFKTNYFRDEILISLLKCNVIGFHSFDSSKNFLTSIKKILQANLLSTNKGDLAVNYLENNTLIRVKNVTPEFDLIKNDIISNEFNLYYKELEKKYDKNIKKQIFISIEQNKYLLCIKNKLEGYKKFLEKGDNNNISKNLFLLYINSTKEDLYKNSKNKLIMEKIENLIKKIKKDFGDDIIEINIGKIEYIQRLALFAFSNCILYTNKNEDNYLGLYEFLLIKKFFFEKNNFNINDLNIEKYCKNKNMINIAYIVSNLSEINSSLGGAVKINPYDYISLYKSFSLVNTYLNTELNLNKKKEKENYLLTIKQDFLYSEKFSFKNWFYNFLKDIKSSKLSDENTFFICNDECTQFKLKKINKKFKKIVNKYISLNYEKSHNRLILFDFEGTLPSDNYKPTDEIIDLLNELTKDKRNKIFIIAERGKNQVWEWFKDVKNLGLGTEYGFKYIINDPEKKNNWIKIIKNYNNSWIQNCVDIITPYTEKYEGSFLDIKESSVVWNYKDCDQDLGKNLASILISELSNLINEYNIKIVNGKGFIEVIPFGIHKGYFLSYIIKKQIKKGRTPDFIMCVGDDKSDEKMFNYLLKKENEIKKYSKQACIYCITVGKKPSKAKYYVDSVRNVKEIINTLVKISEKTGSSISSSIIRKSKLNLKYNIDNEKNKEE